MNGYVKYFDNNNKCISYFMIKNYYKNTIKYSILLKKGFDSEPEYYDKYIKTKIKILP